MARLLRCPSILSVSLIVGCVSESPPDATQRTVTHTVTTTNTVTVPVPRTTATTDLPVACYGDSDGDGFGSGPAVACTGHTVDNDLDCDDLDPTLGGGAEVPYTGRDEDCDPATPDDDLDADGLPLALDCDDDDALAGGGLEVPYDGRDNDCDPATPDDDLDGDGATVADDCDDLDDRVAHQVDDYDCDGALALDDCDDADGALGSVTDDGDCDGVLAADDCDDADPATGWLADCADRDSDGWADGDDCAPDDADVHPSASPRAFRDTACDGRTSRPLDGVRDTYWPRLADARELGRSVAMGDVDGDGLAELAFGRDPLDPFAAASAHVVFGHDRPTTAEAMPSAATVVITDVPGSDAAVALGGDLDGDGVGDLLVAPGGFYVPSELAVFLSSAPLAPGTHAYADAPVHWSEALDLNYVIPRFVPDLDGDGIDEVALATSFRWGEGDGAVTLLRGSTLLTTPQQATFTGPSSFGSALATGDVDGDGRADLLVGADDLPSDRGALAVFFADQLVSGLGGELDDADVQVVADGRVFFGAAVASLGDLDGDGLDDVVVGAPWHNEAGTSHAGLAAVFLGEQLTDAASSGTELSDDDAFHRIVGETDSDSLGMPVHGPGDLDGDGVPDLLVAAQRLGDGELLLVSGVTLVGGTALRTDHPTVTDPQLYDEAALAHGDIDGDGLPDVAMGHDGVSLLLNPWRTP